MSAYQLSHLKELEAESIHIIREVAAEFENPVMLYSIGKDSSVMVRLAEKAFYPGKVPFPLMPMDFCLPYSELSCGVFILYLLKERVRIVVTQLFLQEEPSSTV